MNEINGADGNDTLVSGIADDLINGGLGDDRIETAGGNNSLIAGEGDDTILAGDGNDTIDGGLGDDFINSGDGDNLINGSRGNDTISSGSGDDSIFGASENDRITSGAGDDELFGGGGDDLLNAGTGNDLLDGGGGNDTLQAGSGNDTLFGGEGDDLLTVSNSFGSRFQSVNIIDGGGGNDTINITNRTGSGFEQHQIHFSLGGGHDLINYNDISTSPTDEDDASIIFDEGISPEGVELDRIDGNLVFRILETDETLSLDYQQGLFPRTLSVEFASGEFIDFGFFTDEFISHLTRGDETVNLGDLLTGDIVNTIQGTALADSLEGSTLDDLFISEGLVQGVETIRGNGGSDRIIFDEDDSRAQNSASEGHAEISIQDFTIDDTQTNNDADILDIGAFLLGSNLDASNIGNYVHVFSGGFDNNGSILFIDREGQLTDVQRNNLNNNPAAGGNGVDLYLEFQGDVANNNIASLTGFADNSIEQFQALLDLGFLDVSDANRNALPRLGEDNRVDIIGTSAGDILEGTEANEDFFSGGVNGGFVSESIRGNGGSDRFVLSAEDNFEPRNIIRVRDFTIDDITLNNQADVFDLSQFLNADNLSAENLSNYLHINSGTFANFASEILISRDGNFTDDIRPSRGGDVPFDVFVEFQNPAGAGNNFADITGEQDNTVEQFQALIDLGFLTISDSISVSPSLQDSNIIGTENADDLIGGQGNEVFLSGGVSQGVESIRSNGGSDTLVLDADDALAQDGASNGNAHFRIRDFTIGDTTENDEADRLDIGGFLLGSDLDASNIGNYLHIVSGTFGNNRSSIFIDREGQFTDQARANLTNNAVDGGNGADLFLEFQGQTSNNNIAELTGFADNTVEQFQALIDLGFLDLSNANSEAPPRLEDLDTSVVIGSAEGDGVGEDTGLLGRENQDNDIFSGGLGDGERENVQGIGSDAQQSNSQDIRGTTQNNIDRSGNDRLIIDGDDTFADDASAGNGQIFVRGFTVGDIRNNDNADSLVIGDLLRHSNNTAGFDGTAADAVRFLHFVELSPFITLLYIDRDGQLGEQGSEEREFNQSDNLFSGLVGEANYFLEFRTLHNTEDNVFDFTPNGEALNTVEQIQALIDLGFLDVSEGGVTSAPVEIQQLQIQGTQAADNLIGSGANELFFSGGASQGAESIRTNGGADTLVLDSNDAASQDSASNGNAHFRIRDFTIDNILENDEADVLDISDLLSGFSIETTNLGDHLHIISGTFGNNRSSIFIDRDGTFDDVERAALDANVVAGGQGADLFLEFQGQAGDNNFERITGFADNTQEQLQALIDLGFLDVA